MNAETLTEKKRAAGFFSRVMKYAIVRAISLFIAVAISLYLTILIASRSGVIESEMTGNKLGGWLSGIWAPRLRMTSTDQQEIFNSPFIRSLNLLIQGLTFNFGESNVIYIYSKTDVKSIILDFLSRTLVLFGTANLLLFITSISLSLFLSRRYGSLLDKLIVALSPLSSAPAWVYGLALTVLAARLLHYYPSGIFNAWPTELTVSSVSYVLRRLALPIIAIFLSKLFLSIYTWRTFFLIHSSEDYVEMARAKGLSSNLIERRYILRPALPSLLTSFAMMVVGIWQEAIIIELFFGVAGIGHLFYRALQLGVREMPLLIGLTAIFAYLLAISVFLLDLIYALVDPRMKLGNEEQSLKAARVKVKKRFRLWSRPARATDPFVIIKPAAKFSQLPHPLRKKTIQDRIEGFGKWVGSIAPALREILRYPSAVLGLVIIVALIGISIYTVIYLPYGKTIATWRGEDFAWRYNPKTVPPAWINFFRKDKLPETIRSSTQEGDTPIYIKADTGSTLELTVPFRFNYPYDGFPQDLIIKFYPCFKEKFPHATLTWITPDDRRIDLGGISIETTSYEYYLSRDERLLRKLGGRSVLEALFSDPAAAKPVALHGTYELRVEVMLFEEDADLNAEMVLYGQVFGLAGTDNRRRDLMVPLLWGTPVALAFGLLGAVGANLITMILAAVGSWFGGWIDGLIQRITEINMVLPAFPVLVLVYTLYSKSIWLVLGCAVLLNIFSNSLKTYRAAFLQVKEATYIEAARTYGASNWRLIFFYLVPRILPVLIPQLVVMVPGLVFLEATLAYLNLSDPVLPTWGKVIQEAASSGALTGSYYWILEPAGMLMLTGLAFAMLGFALDRILNPRLRSQ